MIFIRRTSSEDDSNLPDEVDSAGQPPGLCFLYKPASPAAGIETLAITNFERTGNGFWSADLTDSLTKAGVWDTPPNNPDATTSLHSVVIEDVRTADDRAASSPSGASAFCGHATPVKGQTISVRAMILVNKKANE